MDEGKTSGWEETQTQTHPRSGSGGPTPPPKEQGKKDPQPMVVGWNQRKPKASVRGRQMAWIDPWLPIGHGGIHSKGTEACGDTCSCIAPAQAQNTSTILRPSPARSSWTDGKRTKTRRTDGPRAEIAPPSWTTSTVHTWATCSKFRGRTRPNRSFCDSNAFQPSSSLPIGISCATLTSRTAVPGVEEASRRVHVALQAFLSLYRLHRPIDFHE